MPRLAKLVAGLTVLQRHTGGHGDECSFEHDIGHFPGPAPAQLSAEERTILEENGFFWDEEAAHWSLFS